MFQDGFGYAQVNIKDGWRHSTSSAYLDRIRHRSNLKIMVNSMATKILFDNRKRAIGVRFITGDETFDVKSRKEVIISAGAINTAKLLMLSGVGPADHLTELGIDVIADLPVGRNLQDHVMALLGLFTVSRNAPVISLSEITSPESLSSFFVGGSGKNLCPEKC